MAGSNKVALKLTPQPVWPVEFLDKYRRYLSRNFPRVAKESIPWTHVSIDRLPDLDQLITAVERRSRALDSGSHKRQILFTEIPSAVEFVYQNGHDSQTPGARMFEQTGGGVAAFDLDSDGWTDLFFPQGGQWDAASRRFMRSMDEVDTVYRNYRGRFDDVSSLSLPADTGFGQGDCDGK